MKELETEAYKTYGYEITSKDKIIAVLSAIGLVVSIVLLILLPFHPSKIAYVVSAFSFFFCILYCVWINAF